MLTYPVDLSQPYSILNCNVDGTYTVKGFAKTLHVPISEMTVEFGGHPAIFILRKNEFLSKTQKHQLRWVKKHLGDRQHDKLLEEIYDSAIADHIIKDT